MLAVALRRIRTPLGWLAWRTLLVEILIIISLIAVAVAVAAVVVVVVVVTQGLESRFCCCCAGQGLA